MVRNGGPPVASPCRSRTGVVCVLPPPVVLPTPRLTAALPARGRLGVVGVVGAAAAAEFPPLLPLLLRCPTRLK